MEKENDILLREIKAGNPKAYHFLYKHYYVMLCNLAYGFVSDSFIAESIVNDLFIHIWEIRDSLKPDLSFTSYLIKAVRNRSLNYLKAQQHKIFFSELPLESMDSSAIFKDEQLSPLNNLMERELEVILKQAINALPPDTYRVFMKSRFQNKNNTEIAQDLEISVNTVKYHIKKALSFIREYLLKYMTYLIPLLSHTLLHLFENI